jgi:hypothetical protein
MIKVIKWEFIKRSKELKVFYIILIAITIINLLLPIKALDILNIFLVISSLFGGMVFLFVALLTIIGPAKDLGNPNIYMEKTAAKKTWEVLGAKLINNFIYLNILYFLELLLSYALNRFSTENMHYLQLEFNYFTVGIMGILLPLEVLFFYLLAKSLVFTKNHPTLVTIIMFVIASALTSRLLELPTVGSLLNDSLIIRILVLIVISAGLLLGSCNLYEKYFEVV